MTPENLKQENPDLYNSIFNQGVDQEKKRVATWLNSGLSNRWEIRDGIKSGITYEDFSTQELTNFYTPVEERLDGKVTADTPDPKNQKPDIYSLMELNEFYAEVDKRLKK